MLLVLTVLGVLISSLLIWFNVRRYPSSVYLGLFFLNVSIYGMYQYVLGRSGSAPLIAFFLALIPIFASIFYLIGPLFYWYFRSVLTDSPALKKRDFWHFIPMVVFFIASLPGAFEPYSGKMEAAEAIANNLTSIADYKPTLLSGVLSYPILFISRPALILCYALWVTGMFFSFLLRKESTRVYSSQRYMIGWLSLLLGALLILVFSHIFHLLGFTTGSSLFRNIVYFLKGLSITGLSILLISPLFYPSILYGLPRLPEPLVSRKNEGAESEQVQDEKGPQQRFEASYVGKIAENLTSCMQNEKAYLLTDCNIVYVAKKLNIPAHHLAIFFREEMKDSFTNYRNSWRVKHSIDLINQGKTQEYTIEAIGQLSGFSSRNAFFTAFRKMTGTSPGAYSAQAPEPSE